MLRRYRGGTYSATVEEITFADGSTARTDLIRLVPDVEVYSLDFHGTYPQGTATYREASWTSAANARLSPMRDAIDWILRHSYPRISLETLTASLRAAGHSLGPGYLQQHEAIAATQAALWHFTNDLGLDTAPLDAPISVDLTHADERLTSRINPAQIRWNGQLLPGDSVAVEAEMLQPVSLAAFAVTFGEATTPGVTVHLERSADGRTWAPVPAAVLEHGEAPAPVIRERRIGLGAAVSRITKGTPVGYRHYRLVVTAPRDEPGVVDLQDVEWTLAGRRFRNSSAVVELYRFLVDRARAYARAQAEIASRPLLRAPTLARVGEQGSDLGPVRWLGTGPVRVRILGSAPAQLVNADGRPVEQLFPGREYTLRIGPVVDAGELQIQLTRQDEEVILLRGTSSIGDSSRMAPLAWASGQSQTHHVTHRLILVPYSRRAAMKDHPSSLLQSVR